MMGMAPAAVDLETPASMYVAFQAFKRFHGIKDGDAISDDEFLQMLAAEQAAGRA
jgi:hypothetical protein